MPAGHEPSLGRRSLTRLDVELIVAVAWNEEGARRGLLPLAWGIGEGDYLHFTGSADGYAAERRREIVEAWIADIGLADGVDLLTDPLRRRGSDVVWSGDVGGIGVEFHYPAASQP
ncbi:hypothetical protein [Clavibacter capsici]|uniref:Uncharacterized protein n=1 Tax=Clavibacter capsici TaxID=1874630 RepID=A0AAE6XNL3_9MICO|nr:hypothetical protein [Clavibacter capsici]QIS38469.1 hypothetical protein GW572_03450 [Clavibacter capsici]QIS41265.1 hypothetical protein GW571_03445 [Clavibacter capsici]QIS44207.1 hypothetical protein GW570_03425 [Clavibacter capsici]